MSQKTLLAIDLSYQTYRAAAAHPMLTSGRHFTGGLFGFFTTLAKMIRETEATDLVICSDCKPYLRSQEYPEYKQIRKAAVDEERRKMFKSSLRLVTEVLGELEFPIWGIPGFESDDLIAHAGLKYRHRFEHIYAGSNDSDLFQLLWMPNFSIYTTGITSVWTGKLLMEKHGVTPDQYMLATALQGTHNDVAGIAGVGVKTALKAAKDPALLRTLRDKHAKLIDRNLGLIKLPHRQFPLQEMLPKRPPPLESRTLYRCMGRYDIDVTASMLNSLDQVTRHAQ